MRTLRRRCLTAFARALGGLAMAAAAPLVLAGPDPHASAEASRLQMEALKYKQASVIEADVALHLQKVEADRAEARYRRAYQEMQIAELDRVGRWRESEHAFNMNLHQRQMIYDPVILMLVVAVVSGGMWFSYLQFTIERRRRIDLVALLRELKNLPEDSALRTSALNAWNPAQGAGPHTLELGPIKISSNVVGLLVLAMSLAFFYLYLERVYRIGDKPPKASTTVSAAADPETAAPDEAPGLSNAASGARPASTSASGVKPVAKAVATAAVSAPAAASAASDARPVLKPATTAASAAP